MSLVQQIRDKYARWAVVAIALSLLGFIMMDAFGSRSSVFGGNETTVGKINGKKIEIQDFEAKVKSQEEYARQQGYNMGGESRQQVVESVWNQEVEQAVMGDEFEKLGLAIGSKEMGDILFGANPPADFKQSFTDPNTGVYNAQAAQQSFNNLKKTGSPEAKAQMNQYLANLEFVRLNEKYNSLLMSSTYFPKWFLEKQNTDNSLLSKVSFVNAPYASISDSAVKVSDNEIVDYMKKHENDFKQEEETRSISYVVFNASPSSSDSADTRNQLVNLKPEFQTTADPAAFVSRNGSSLPYFDGYIAKGTIQVPAKDSILGLPSGAVYGPYLDASNFVLAKLVDTRSLPDSVKCRHILLGTTNPQTGQPLFPDSVAKQKADSVAAAIAGGASFDDLEARYSTDQAAHKEKGVMTFSSYDIQGENFAKEFGQFILLQGKPGDKKVVKTNFGYHYIEILEHKNVQPHYKVAYLAKPINPSESTDNTAANAANLFAGDSRDLKAFNDNYEKNLRSKGLNKLTAPDLKPNDFSIPGLGNSRPFVKAIFEADQGDVMQPHRVGDNYVVAVVTDVNEAGLASVGKARPIVEPVLRNQKKAAELKKKIGNITTLEAAAAALGQPVQVADSLRFNGNRNPVLGYEARVLGAAFNQANKGKVVPEALEGQGGVYVVRVDNLSTTPVETAAIEQQRMALEMQARQTMAYRSPSQALRKAAKIKDNRSRFY
ncbi:peptidylprolyl isomerase [Paraflavisolibacter sp. H34]|uniref:peptidylprolyl isomerase n=1 Tax=Huijunlia imazamoxiresistens TaxID=3127457 RepID=UPI00301633FE